MVYQLKHIPKTYKTLQLDVMTIAEKLGDYDLITTLMNAPLTGDSLAGKWKTMETTLQSLSSSGREIPDIALWDSQGLYLSAKAYDALAESLKTDGEFLPIVVNDKPAYLFNCRVFGKEDLSLTERKYLDGEPDGVVSLVFDEADVTKHNRHVFRSKLQGCTILYASENFKQLVEQHHLNGVTFDEDLLNSFV
ncbi:hypothetical protein [Rheinheimera metallidurans]|uniref:hypothetical protein n=1 Tax=Rheinheimera metallidurans TaxID=2925781 RepID=UPI0030038B28